MKIEIHYKNTFFCLKHYVSIAFNQQINFRKYPARKYITNTKTYYRYCYYIVENIGKNIYLIT